MMPDNPQPTPPLPDEIEAAIQRIVDVSRIKDFPRLEPRIIELRQAIATALAQEREEDEEAFCSYWQPRMTALRERCERLRKIVVAESEAEDECDPPDFVYDVWKANYRESDLADDLLPAQEAAT